MYNYCSEVIPQPLTGSVLLGTRNEPVAIEDTSQKKVEIELKHVQDARARPGVIPGCSVLPVQDPLLYPDIRTAIPPTLSGTFLDTTHGPILVGTGPVTDDQCGKWIRVGAFIRAHVCPVNQDHRPHPIKHSCNDPACPECHPRYLQIQSERISARVDGFIQAKEDLQRTLDGTNARPVYRSRHFMISPPVGVVNRILNKCRLDGEQEYDYTKMVVLFREAGYKAFEQSGLDGASVIIHWYRPRKELAGIIQKQMAAQGYKDRWQFIIHQKNWRDYVAFSPHIHLIAYGYAKDTDTFYEDTNGWTIRMIRKAHSTQGLAYYLLSHASPIEGRVSVTWIGCLSNRRLKVEMTYYDREDVICEECEKEGVYTMMMHGLLDEDLKVASIYDRPVQRKIFKQRYRIQVSGPPPLSFLPGGPAP